MALTKIGTDGVKDDAVTLAKQAAGTDGQIITYDASGNPVAVGPGTDGQVLTSTGAGSPPAFETLSVPAGTTINNNADNRVITGSGTANTLEGESNLLFDGSKLLLGTTTEGEGDADDLTIASSGNTGITIRSGQTNDGAIFFSDGTSGDEEFEGTIQYLHSTNAMIFKTDHAERMRVTSSGGVGINGTPQNNIALHVKDSANTPTMQVGNDNVLTLRGGTASGDISVSYVTGAGYKPLKFFTSDTERMRLQTGGVLSVAQGIELGSGVDGTAANTLDDYEEGTWTPTFVNLDDSSKGTINYASYRKIGGLVHVDVKVFISSSVSDTSGIGLTMPFTKASVSGGSETVFPAMTSKGNISVFLRMFDAQSSAYGREVIDDTSVTYNELAGDEVFITGTYQAA